MYLQPFFDTRSRLESRENAFEKRLRASTTSLDMDQEELDARSGISGSQHDSIELLPANDGGIEGQDDTDNMSVEKGPEERKNQFPFKAFFRANIVLKRPFL